MAEHLHHVADDEVVVLRRAFVGTVVVARIRGREFRHLIIFDVAIFHLVHVLPANLHAAVFRHNEEAALHVLVPHGGGIVQAAHATVHEIERDEPGILKVGQRRVVEIGKTGLDVANVAEEPIHDVDEMGELGEERAAVQPCIAMPSARLVVTLVAIPIAIQLHHVDFPQASGFDHLLYPDRRRRVTVLHHAESQPLVTQAGIDHALGILCGKRHGLLNYHMMSCLNRPYCHLRMKPVRRAYINDVNLQIGCQ